VRTRLRERFATTLPRFDLMAQLERNPDGLKMGELSRRLMVTGGNVTGVTDQLVAEGLVRREPIAGDRRAHAVRLTPKGKQAFDAMAAEHEGWVEELLSGLTRAERAHLYALLGRLKTTIHERAGPPQARIVPPRGEGAQRQGGPNERAGPPQARIPKREARRHSDERAGPPQARMTPSPGDGAQRQESTDERDAGDTPAARENTA
jgi:DNA-binding MarR family transcriptional regulator